MAQSKSTRTRYTLTFSDGVLKDLESLAAARKPTVAQRLRRLIEEELYADSLASIADGVRVDLPAEVIEPIDDLSRAIRENQTDRPQLLIAVLPYLPSTRQARLLILAMTALNALLEYADTEIGIEQPAHITMLAYAIAAVATLLNEAAAPRD
jgi:hypothetical protein